MFLNVSEQGQTYFTVKKLNLCNLSITNPAFYEGDVKDHACSWGFILRV